VGCKRSCPDTELVRFVLNQGVLQPDPARSAPGRGAWLHPVSQCIEAARKQGGFARSFRRLVDDSVLDGFEASA
jgi:predicted RNA-binding protein YlxR (DUF448 family)